MLTHLVCFQKVIFVGWGIWYRWLPQLYGSGLSLWVSSQLNTNKPNCLITIKACSIPKDLKVNTKASDLVDIQAMKSPTNLDVASNFNKVPSVSK